jgi:hypothetical protein
MIVIATLRKITTNADGICTRNQNARIPILLELKCRRRIPDYEVRFISRRVLVTSFF